MVPCEGAGEVFTIEVTAEGPLRSRIDLSVTGAIPEGADPLALRLDVTPRWPHCYLDVTVLDAEQRPLAHTWRSAERNRMLVPVPAKSTTCFLQFTDPRPKQPPLLPEEGRTVVEPESGLIATVCRWFDGRDAALSLRFDDSHPTHITTAIPMLREYGFTGTFFINPGAGDYLAHADAWADCAGVGDQELANHTMHHRGAENDEDAEREIGEATEHIRTICGRPTGLIAFSEGGGTVWTHTRALREILDRHGLFDAYGRPGISMADSYGGRVEAFREGLDRAIATGGSFTALFHQIGESISLENFRAVLDLAREREDALWIAGVAAAHMYQTERNAAALRCEPDGAGRVRLTLDCGTDAALYDRPLTIALVPPAAWDAEALQVVAEDGTPLETRVRPRQEGAIVLFDAPPHDAEFIVSRG